MASPKIVPGQSLVEFEESTMEQAKDFVAMKEEWPDRGDYHRSSAAEYD
jgi:hypothetical protein